MSAARSAAELPLLGAGLMLVDLSSAADPNLSAFMAFKVGSSVTAPCS
jgi:hypothetical protein